MRINPARLPLAQTGFLRRRSSMPIWADLVWRVGLVFGLIALVLLIHWVGRDGLKDNLDDQISFVDVLYFTTVTVTTVGYGDIVPVSPEARLFEALLVTPIRLFVWLIFLGTAYNLFFRNIFYRWRMARIQADLHNHIIVTGFGTSGGEAVRELLARGVDPRGRVGAQPEHCPARDRGGRSAGQAAGGGGGSGLQRDVRRFDAGQDAEGCRDQPRASDDRVGGAGRYVDFDNADGAASGPSPADQHCCAQ